ncbi:MAG: alpha/beta hydrolase [Solirubrobacterales bacterium]|nr:alpha/beta hydrolase [Solirubrobacterales bacterium]
MATVRRQIVATVQNGLIRPGADATYADGDDASWMGVDWPSMTRRIDVLGRRVNTVDTGGDDKPALLYIHGLGGNWQNWLLSIPPLMETHRVVAMDLPGFGFSELPAEAISIQGYARVVDALCDALHIEVAAVVGNSMGGFIGAELALSLPTRVERLVLVSAAGLSIEDQPREPLLGAARLLSANARYFIERRDLVVRRPRLRRAALQTVIRYPEKLSPPLTWELLSGVGKPGYVDALDALMSYSFRERLTEISMPVLIVWGRNDMLVPVGDSRRFEELIGDNARRIVFDDTGHAPMIERPTRFNELLRGFVAGDPVPEAGVTGVHAA